METKYKDDWNHKTLTAEVHRWGRRQDCMDSCRYDVASCAAMVMGIITYDVRHDANLRSFARHLSNQGLPYGDPDWVDCCFVGQVGEKIINDLDRATINFARIECGGHFDNWTDAQILREFSV